MLYVTVSIPKAGMSIRPLEGPFEGEKVCVIGDGIVLGDIETTLTVRLLAVNPFNDVAVIVVSLDLAGAELLMVA